MSSCRHARWTVKLPAFKTLAENVRFLLSKHRPWQSHVRCVGILMARTKRVAIYVRVSTGEQTTANQLKELKA